MCVCMYRRQARTQKRQREEQEEEGERVWERPRRRCILLLPLLVH
jgi:hypothetical protein